MPTSVKNAKIACLDFNLNKFKLQLCFIIIDKILGISINIENPKELEKIR